MVLDCPLPSESEPLTDQRPACLTTRLPRQKGIVPMTTLCLPTTCQAAGSHGGPGVANETGLRKSRHSPARAYPQLTPSRGPSPRTRKSPIGRVRFPGNGVPPSCGPRSTKEALTADDRTRAPPLKDGSPPARPTAGAHLAQQPAFSPSYCPLLSLGPFIVRCCPSFAVLTTKRSFPFSCALFLLLVAHCGVVVFVLDSRHSRFAQP